MQAVMHRALLCRGRSGRYLFLLGKRYLPEIKAGYGRKEETDHGIFSLYSKDCWTQQRKIHHILLGASVLSGCTKDEFLDQYNNIVQSAGSIALTGNSSLQGTKEKGIDDYTGSYTANYEDFSDTEYLFGGTSIKREAGKDLSIDCALEVTEGTAKVFWISGADEAVTLFETTGTYSDTITLPEGGNYIGIECENFTGNIELNIE